MIKNNNNKNNKNNHNCKIKLIKTGNLSNKIIMQKILKFILLLILIKMFLINLIKSIFVII